MPKLFQYFKVLLLSTVFLMGCQRPTIIDKGSIPQPVLNQSIIFIGEKRIPCFVEIADQKHQIQLGLMGRESLTMGMGMFFVLPKARRVGFWMKNTPLELSIAYIDPNFVIQEIYDLHPLNEALVISRRDDILYALEVPRGWFGSHKIGVGDIIQFK